MKKHNKLWKVLSAITIAIFILSCVTVLNMFILYAYGITTPLIPACIAGSSLFISLTLLPLMYYNLED